MRSFILIILWIDMRKKKPAKFTNRRYDKECMELAKKIVRLRDKMTCQKCWSRKAPQCSHVISDWSDTRLSVDPLNMKILCMPCHMYWRHRNPIEAYERYKGKFPRRFEYLKARHKEYMTMGSIWISWRQDTHTELLRMYNKLCK